MRKSCVVKYSARILMGLVGLSLAACLSGPDSGSTGSGSSSSPSQTPPVVSNKVCSAPVPYDVSIDAQPFYQNPKLHFHKLDNKKWFGSKVVFDYIDELPLSIVHLDKEALVLSYVILPHEHSDPKNIRLSMNSYRGVAVQPEAMEYQIVAKESFSPSWKIRLGDCDNQDPIADIDRERSKNKSHKSQSRGKFSSRFVDFDRNEKNRSQNDQKQSGKHDDRDDDEKEVSEAILVSVTIHLEKLVFGGQFSAADILNDAQNGSGRVVFEIHGVKGFAKIYSANLILQGNQPGSCLVTTTTMEPSQGSTTTTTTMSAIPQPAPVVQIDSTSESGLTNATAIQIGFSADQPAGFQCSLDQAPFDICTSPFSAMGLVDGTHQFSVKAITSDGRESIPASFNWNIDATMPVISIISSDPAETFTALDHISIAFAANESVTFSCQLDGSAWAACASPFTQSGLFDGSHFFSVFAQDSARNGSSTASYSWQVKTLPPSVEITAVIPSANPSNSGNHLFSFVGTNGAAQFACSVDAGIELACSSPYQVSSLQDGAHLFSVVAVDGVGNRSVAAMNSFTIDLTPPEVSITSLLPGQNPTSRDSLQIAFASNESGTLMCSLDGVLASPCLSPVSLVGQQEGAHHFQVSAIDLGGNMSPTFAEYNWTVDMTAPVIQLVTVNPTATSINQNNISLSFSVSEAGFSSCSFDGNLAIDCSVGSIKFADFTEGQHSISVVATDLAGNQSLPFVYPFSVDTVAPALQITSVEPSSALTNSSSMIIGFSSSEPSTFVCRLDAADNYTACSSPISYGTLIDGTHQFSVKATDQSGNVSAPVTYTWIVDATAPVTTITSSSVVSGSMTSAMGVTFNFSSNESGSIFVCQLDGLGFQGCSSPMNYSGLSDGVHQFDVRAIDAAGNSDAIPTDFSWIVDATPIMISNLSISNITRTSAVITWLTNKPTTSQVANAIYGGTYGYTTLNGSLVTSHSVTVSGLSPLSLYTVYTMSADAYGSKQSSSTLSFRTAR